MRRNCNFIINEVLCLLKWDDVTWFEKKRKEKRYNKVKMNITYQKASSALSDLIYTREVKKSITCWCLKIDEQQWPYFKYN